jgi:hypothetical protein
MSQCNSSEDRSRSNTGRGVAVGTALAVATVCPLFGCGGLARDGRQPLLDDSEVRAEPLPQRFADCNALLAYTGEQAEGIVAAAPTGSPFPPLYAPGAGTGFEAPAYAEWPEASRQGGAGRVAHARGDGSAFEDYYFITDDTLQRLSMNPNNVEGSGIVLPPALIEARGQGRPAWVFAQGSNVLVVAELSSSPADALRPQVSTLFWQLETDGPSTPRSQSLNYVNARLIGARNTNDTVQVALLAEAPSAIDFTSLAAEARTDVSQLDQVRTHNREAIAGAAGSDWLPRRTFADAESGDVSGAGQAAVECSDIYAPATPSGLQLLTLVDLRLSEGLDSWQASGLYTGNVQISSSDQSWAFVTEPWWSVSEDAANRAAQGSPETLLHSFGLRDRKLVPLGSIAVRGAPEHDPVVAAGDDGQWFLATHSAYGPASPESDQGRIWSFESGNAALQLLGKSPRFERDGELHSDFVPGVAYVRTRDGAGQAKTLLLDLSHSEALELLPGPGGDVRVIPWSEGRHLRVDATQIQLLSGTRELAQYPQLAPPSLPAYADPVHGWLVDLDQAKSYRQNLRFSRFDGVEPPSVTGTARMHEGTILPPLIESDVILNMSYVGLLSRGSSAYAMEVLDAKTLQSIAGVGGSSR